MSVRQGARIDGRQIVVENCTICGGTHYHGAATVDDVGDTTSRAPHCHASDVTEYVLVVEEVTA